MPPAALRSCRQPSLTIACRVLAADVHVNIDDCWQLTNRTLPWENPNARQIANPVRFPNGMKVVADYVRTTSVWTPGEPGPPDFHLLTTAVGTILQVHSKGLKFGVYTARCKYTCQLFAASFGHELVDAKQWAEWGVVSHSLVIMLVVALRSCQPRVHCDASSHPSIYNINGGLCACLSFSCHTLRTTSRWTNATVSSQYCVLLCRT
jgi:hypothetical protein